MRLSSERELRRLDDKCIELSRLDSAYKLGVLRGQSHELQINSYCMGIREHPGKVERSHYYRLQKHLEREYRRLARKIYRG